MDLWTGLQNFSDDKTTLDKWRSTLKVKVTRSIAYLKDILKKITI
jgi:hypothetical protein